MGLNYHVKRSTVSKDPKVVGRKRSPPSWLGDKVTVSQPLSTLRVERLGKWTCGERFTMVFNKTDGWTQRLFSVVLRYHTLPQGCTTHILWRANLQGLKLVFPPPGPFRGCFYLTKKQKVQYIGVSGPHLARGPYVAHALFTWNKCPIRGRSSVFPGMGRGHWSTSWQATSRLTSPLS